MLILVHLRDLNHFDPVPMLLAIKKKMNATATTPNETARDNQCSVITSGVIYHSDGSNKSSQLTVATLDMICASVENLVQWKNSTFLSKYFSLEENVPPIENEYFGSMYRERCVD